METTLKGVLVGTTIVAAAMFVVSSVLYVKLNGARERETTLRASHEMTVEYLEHRNRVLEQTNDSLIRDLLRLQKKEITP